MTDLLAYQPGMPSLGGAALTIGVFDGVHLGHQALVHDTVSLAGEKGVASAVVTFDRDPDRVVDPAHAAPQLLELSDKLELLAALGPDVVLVVPFTPEVAAMPPDAFLERLLLGVFEPAVTLVGHDFRFGARAAGGLAVLESFGRGHGFEVIGHPLVRVEGAPVTSTRIRMLLAEGDVAEAARLLGRPHLLRGTVEQGRQVGRELGAATANLRHAPYAAVPADGVYAAEAFVEGRRYPAAVSVGKPPTFDEAPSAVEAHLLDFDGDIYGRELLLGFLQRIRPLERFDTPERLAAAIAGDVRAVRTVVGGA